MLCLVYMWRVSSRTVMLHLRVDTSLVSNSEHAPWLCHIFCMFFVIQPAKWRPVAAPRRPYIFHPNPQFLPTLHSTGWPQDPLNPSANAIFVWLVDCKKMELCRAPYCNSYESFFLSRLISYLFGLRTCPVRYERMYLHVILDNPVATALHSKMGYENMEQYDTPFKRLFGMPTSTVRYQVKDLTAC